MTSLEVSFFYYVLAMNKRFDFIMRKGFLYSNDCLKLGYVN